MSQKRIKDLETKINQARNDYYNEEPTVSDQVYDAWVDELTKLDPNNKAVTDIGAETSSAWPKVQHEVPMGSLNKVNTIEEFNEWLVSDCKEDENAEVLLTEKLDGISISLRYQKGTLIQAITRGDGETGEDITPNIKKMKGVKSKLNEKYSGHIRGEILLRKSDWKKHFPEKKNPRNGASGIAKRQDGKGSEHLTVLFYTIESDLKTEKEAFDYIRDLGLSTPYYTVCNFNKAVEIYKEYQASKREKLDHDIDGLVCRINNLARQEELGEKNHRPKGAIAVKFDAAGAETILRRIVWQVGKTGRITPVAEFDPVDILGSTVERASLYNYKYIKDNKIDIGATILVIKANDVIPRVAAVIKGTGTTAKPPKHCSECDADTVMDGEYLCCPNSAECPAQSLGRLSIWIKELNILKWGKSTLVKLLDSEKVSDIGDLYRLTADDIASLDRMGKKSAENLIAELDKFREVAIENLIGGLGIKGVATSTTKLLVEAGYETLEDMYALTSSDVENVKGFAAIRAKAFCDGLKKNKERIDDILAAGVKIKGKVKGALTGMSFCFTGTLSKPRAELQQIVKENGGDVKKDVGKGLDFLVSNDLNSTSSKSLNAKKFGTKIITEEKFFGLLAG